MTIRPYDGFRAGCRNCLASTGANACALGAKADWNTRHVNYFANLGKALWMVGLLLEYGEYMYIEGAENAGNNYFPLPDELPRLLARAHSGSRVRVERGH